MNSFLYENHLNKYSPRLKLIVLLLCTIVISSCSDNEQDKSSTEISVSSNETNPKHNDALPIETDATNTEPTATDINKAGRKDGEEFDYQTFRYKISYGQAEFSEVRLSLTQKDVGGLTNTIHALHSMRWNRKVVRLLYNMWDMKTDLYPELAWDKFTKPPVRIALASTLYRIQSLNTLEYNDSKKYKEYIRSYKHDEHEFIRAQVVVALGLAGDPADVSYLKEMAEEENRYVIQSSITALGLMNNKQASDALIDLFKVYKDDPRGKLILDVLKEGYDLHPRYKVSDEPTKEN